MNSDFQGPVNIGSDEMVTINHMAGIITGLSKKKLDLIHVDGPLGVRARNSDNNLIKEKLNWAPEEKLETGLSKLYKWIELQVN
jgi:GDP-D-mannose 3',5'-epimerase